MMLLSRKKKVKEGFGWRTRWRRAGRRGEERSKGPEDGRQRAEQRTRHDGWSEDDGERADGGGRRIRMAWLARPSSIVPAYFECMAMEFYVLLIQVPIACARGGKIIAKIENLHKKSLNSLELMTRWLAGWAAHNTKVGWMYLFCNEKSQPRIKGRMITSPIYLGMIPDHAQPVGVGDSLIDMPCPCLRPVVSRRIVPIHS